MTYRAFIFDYDGTLAQPRQPLEQPMAELLCALLEKGALVDVISGTEGAKLESNIFEKLPCINERYEQFFIQPTTGASLLSYSATGERTEIYAECFSDDEAAFVMHVLDEVVHAHPDWFPKETYGPRVHNRRTGIAMSGLGRDAPVAEKKAWDPQGEKRDALVEILNPLLEQYEVVRGGTTTIDITKKGIDKAFGIRRFLEHTGLSKEETLFVGDAIYPRGTDYPALQTGVDILKVEDPEDTLQKVSPYVDMATPYQS